MTSNKLEREIIKETEDWRRKKSEESSEKQEELECEKREKYEEWQTAEDEETRLKEEIDKVLETMSDRKQAEVIAIKKYSALMDKAKRKSSIAWREWLDVCVKSNPKLTEEYGITKQDYVNLGATDLANKAVEQRKKLLGGE
jgi:hypothetical protein